MKWDQHVRSVLMAAVSAALSAQSGMAVPLQRVSQCWARHEQCSCLLTRTNKTLWSWR